MNSNSRDEGRSPPARPTTASRIFPPRGLTSNLLRSNLYLNQVREHREGLCSCVTQYSTILAFIHSICVWNSNVDKRSQAGWQGLETLFGLGWLWLGLCWHKTSGGKRTLLGIRAKSIKRISNRVVSKTRITWLICRYSVLHEFYPIFRSVPLFCTSLR